MDNKYQITFNNLSVAEANRYSAELRDMLLDLSPDLDVQQVRNEANTQDFGASLILILGTPAVIVIAQGIKSWLEKRNSVTIKIKSDGAVEGTNLTSADALEIVEMVLKTKSE